MKNSLLQKSKDNKKIAMYCFDEKLFHVFVSRAYYSLYQLANSMCPADTLQKNGFISHTEYINRFCKFFGSIYTKEDRIMVTTNVTDLMHFFRMQRNTADYKETEFDFDFVSCKTDFKCLYGKLNELHKTIKKEDSCG